LASRCLGRCEENLVTHDSDTSLVPLVETERHTLLSIFAKAAANMAGGSVAILKDA
jgi:hypothetical protein